MRDWLTRFAGVGKILAGVFALTFAVAMVVFVGAAAFGPKTLVASMAKFLLVMLGISFLALLVMILSLACSYGTWAIKIGWQEMKSAKKTP